MSLGQVYVQSPKAADPREVGISPATVSLPRLDDGRTLHGRYVVVRNGGMINVRDDEHGVALRRIPDAAPDGEGNFIFRPGRGGTRVDRSLLVTQRRLENYIETSHFAEVNTYFHIDRMAAYIHELLAELGAGPIPKVIAVVHAHNAAMQPNDTRDGVKRRGRWAPFQGAHYRLPSAKYDVCEHFPLSNDGEIHLGAGRRRLVHGALSRSIHKPYRHNAGHNAGIICHEYGHHLNRHTADFRDNAHRPADAQSNRKVAMDEGCCDYWAGVMLQSPYIWAWHRRNDARYVHPRSLTSFKTMADFDRGANADPHSNGTIWAAALWDFRAKVTGVKPDGGRVADSIVLKAQILIGRVARGSRPETCRERARFRTGLAALLAAEESIGGGKWRTAIVAAFAARGIRPTRRWEACP